MKKLLTLVGCTVFSVFAACAAKPTNEAAARTAIQKGLAWLAANQQEGGFWSNKRFPALTGLPVWAIANAKDAKYDKQLDTAIRFILGKAQPDGGIYTPDPRRGGAGLGNYNTSVCMMALHATGRKDVIPVILKAREYTASTQLTGDDEHAGGYGYDRGGRRHTDLSNTAMAIDAMRMTQDVEEFRPAGEKKVDLNWENALKYVSGMQQKDGGFLYTKGFAAAPGADAKGTPQRGEGDAKRPLLQSYGSITYDGLLALMHCQLQRNDPRVVSALDFCTKHWTLEENPGQGAQGIYFYYDILTRALNAAGIDEIVRTDGSKVAWRDAVIQKVISLQKPEGYWENENNRWWEADPVLVTSYSLIALEYAAGIAK